MTLNQVFNHAISIVAILGIGAGAYYVYQAWNKPPAPPAPPAPDELSEDVRAALIEMAKALDDLYALADAQDARLTETIRLFKEHIDWHNSQGGGIDWNELFMDIFTLRKGLR